jgi:glycosyltransferase involved in cell wall biosynthesis
MLDAACDAVDADVFVSSGYTSPDTCRSLLYIYDMTPEILGWDMSGSVWQDKNRAIEHASAYACLSKSAARDLRGTHPHTSARPSRVVLPGVDACFAPASQESVREFVSALDLPQTYFMFLGHRDDYKNADLVFDAVADLQVDSDIGLLLVGGQPELEPRYASQAERVTVRIARLSDDDLRAAYSGAAALLYVSRYEGFGLPILEAMACGCPVITCRNSALPEAAGEAAIFVGEDDPYGLREAMITVTDPAVRANLVARGHAWSARFTWAETAAGVEAAIRDVAE